MTESVWKPKEAFDLNDFEHFLFRYKWLDITWRCGLAWKAGQYFMCELQPYPIEIIEWAEIPEYGYIKYRK